MTKRASRRRWSKEDVIGVKDQKVSLQDREEIIIIIDIYTDGSYYDDTEFAGWAFVAIVNDKVFAYNYGTCLPESRQISGELTAATKGTEWALDRGFKGVNIHHDYTGVAFWLVDDPKFGKPWQASKPVVQRYVKDMTPHLSKITFKKVKGHSKNPYNNFADFLADKARKDNEEVLIEFDGEKMVQQ